MLTPGQIQAAAAAIANARGGRRGVPAVSNILDVLPANLRQEVMEDAEAALKAAFPPAPPAEPRDPKKRHPRLFYWEDALDWWAPVPYPEEEIPGIFSIEQLDEHGEEAEIRLKRFDMSDEEFAALPED